MMNVSRSDVVQLDASHDAEHVACIFPSAPGRGGLGRLSADIIRALVAGGHRVSAIGPAAAPGTTLGADVAWSSAPPTVPGWMVRYTPLRWRRGDLAWLAHRRIGGWAARQVKRDPPTAVYAFSEVALETLRWTSKHGVPAIIDNPTGDARHFRAAGEREHARWSGGRFVDHPSRAMVERSVEEYALADRIRVASRFSKASMVEHGVLADKIDVVPYPIDVHRFVPPATRPLASPALRVCSVAAITFAKGFPYLLDAVRAVGAGQIHLELVGGTTSRATRIAFASMRQGLDVVAAPVDDLVEAYHRADVFVLPTLHDGYGFVVAEAMACGLPVVVTDTCGARDLVEPGVTGWVIPNGDTDALVQVLRSAARDRDRLHAMGVAARDAVVAHARRNEGALAAWLATVMRATRTGGSSGALRAAVAR